MDPIFGLPCVMESRAMDSARSRNFRQDKKLARKVDAIDSDYKSRSGKFLTAKSEVQDFLLGIDSPQASRGDQTASVNRKPVRHSMSLKEFDQKMAQKKNRSPDFLLTSALDSTGDSTSSVSDKRASSGGVAGGGHTGNSNTIASSSNNTVHFDVWSGSGDPVVALDKHDFCLTICRNKHVMRDAWDRATSDDVRFRLSLQPRSLSTTALSSPKRQHKQAQASSNTPTSCGHASSSANHAPNTATQASSPTSRFSSRTDKVSKEAGVKGKVQTAGVKSKASVARSSQRP